MTQDEVAADMGATQSFISAIERGQKTPTVRTLERIAEATGHVLEIMFTAEESTSIPAE